MDMSELDYTTMTPHYVAKESFIRFHLPAEGKDLVKQSHESVFWEHLAAHDKEYQRYILDYDENNYEHIPLLVSSLLSPELRV